MSAITSNYISLHAEPVIGQWGRNLHETEVEDFAAAWVRFENLNLDLDAAPFVRIPTTTIGYPNIDREILRTSVFMANVTTAQMRELTLRAGGWVRDNAPILQKAWAEKYPQLAQLYNDFETEMERYGEVWEAEPESTAPLLAAGSGVPIALAPSCRLAREVLARRQHADQVQLIKAEVLVGVARLKRGSKSSQNNVAAFVEAAQIPDGCRRQINLVEAVRGVKSLVPIK